MNNGQELKPVPGLWKVVDETYVEGLSREGWALVRIVADSHVEYGSESVPFLLPGQSYPTTGAGSRSHSIQKHRYVMFLDEKSALAKLAAEAKQQYTELRDTQEKLNGQELAFKELFKAHTKLVESEKQSQKSADKCAENARKDQVVIRKMEQDLAKLRSAIGELKMKEILGEVSVKELLSR